ncbi:proline aminopeptidase P II [Sterolibacterium denitrificans]|uniref:Xaa-Pro aminopeptidase n=2 Tax=Sterolibacterium denitrificans TaxID=157592 RepID=A0A7Z7HP43_9PROT|nr:proline aminopeptidase P II [Sterolibacterium denitrificans]
MALMNIQPFIARRARLLEHMQRHGGGLAVIPTAPEQLRNRDTHYPYRPDSYFHYLSGFGEPEAVLLLIAGDNPRSILFCREKDVEREIWDGFRWGPEAAREAYGFDACHPVAQFDDKLAELLADQPALWFSLGFDAVWDARIAQALNAVRAQARNGKRAPAQLQDVRAALDEMRLIKDASEIELMRRAADIAASAHRRAMQATRPGLPEYAIEAELLHEFRRHGCQAPAYGSIVAGGANACILHYIDNDQPLRDGELLLIDAGGELDGYAADITRTFPVNGRFSGAQADVYRLVLAAQEAAIATVKPGVGFIAPHDAAVHVLAQGMLDLGLLRGSLDGIIESEAYKRYYMHRTSHWLGRDVHDAGDYKHGEQWRALEPGMLLTIEPGCYIRAADDVPAAFHGIGVRIEDDALVTGDGCEIITHEAPKNIREIENLMAEARHG